MTTGLGCDRVWIGCSRAECGCPECRVFTLKRRRRLLNRVAYPFSKVQEKVADAAFARWLQKVRARVEANEALRREARETLKRLGWGPTRRSGALRQSG